MKDLNNPANRHKFLKEAINLNIIIRKLKTIKKEAVSKSMNYEASLINRLIECFEGGDEMEYMELKRQLRYKSVNII